MNTITISDHLHLQFPPDTVRVSVIEVGSRAVRMLVADIAANGSLTPITSEFHQSRLLDALRSSGERLNVIAALQSIRTVALKFSTQAKEFGATASIIVGTAACRELVRNHTEAVITYFPELQVLSGKSEALCSAIAPIDWSHIPARAQRRITIDQGAGSMEISVGRQDGASFLLENYVSLPLGSTELKDSLRKCGGNVSQFSHAIREKITALPIKLNGQIDTVIGMGSVFTNTAWLFVRETPTDTYATHHVHGHTLQLAQLQQTAKDMVSLAAADMQKLRAFIDPRKPNSDEYEILITGIITISWLLAKLGLNTLSVSGYSTRSGVALLLGATDYLMPTSSVSDARRR